MIGVFSRNSELFAPDIWHYIHNVYFEGPHTTAKLKSGSTPNVWCVPAQGLKHTWKTNTSPTPHYPLIFKHGKMDVYKKATDCDIWYDYDKQVFVDVAGQTVPTLLVKQHLLKHKIKCSAMKLHDMLMEPPEEVVKQIEVWQEQAKQNAQPAPSPSMLDFPYPAGTQVPYDMGPEEVTENPVKSLYETLINKQYKKQVPVYSWILKDGVVIRPEPVQDPEIPF